MKDIREPTPEHRSTARQPDRPEVEQSDADTNLSAHAAESGVASAHDPNHEFDPESLTPERWLREGPPHVPVDGPQVDPLPKGFHETLEGAAWAEDHPDAQGPPDSSSTEMDPLDEKIAEDERVRAEAARPDPTLPVSEVDPAGTPAEPL